MHIGRCLSAQLELTDGEVAVELEVLFGSHIGAQLLARATSAQRRGTPRSSDPPAQGTARAKGHSKANRIEKNMSPNPDALLEQFVHWDYLIKEKAVEENFASQTLEEGDVLYGMGPRSAIEIGRKQIIYFCAEVLDEVPCPTMLKEVEDDEEEDEDEELENEVYMEE